MADEWCILKDRNGASEAIRRLGEDDLRYLNHLIVDRLKLISQAKIITHMSQFSIGDRVSFQTRANEQKLGVVGLHPNR